MFRQGVLIAVLLACFSTVVVADDDTINNEISEQFHHAENLTKQGQVTQAIAAYEALIREHPRLPEAYNNLAALYLKQNNTNKAKLILEQGLHADKGYGALYESLTAINVALARDAYSKALQIDLKPAEVAIETLALNDNQPRKTKNAIVISKADTPQVSLAGTPSVTPAEKTEVMPEIKPLAVETAVKPEVVITKQAVVTADKAREENIEIETVVQAWAAAWSAQAVDIYLSFYHEQYHPANGMTRKNWEQSRTIRIKNPDWIKVTLTDFKVERSDIKQAVVTFRQHYESNGYTDVTSKRMVLLYTKNGWQIFQEESV